MYIFGRLAKTSASHPPPVVVPVDDVPGTLGSGCHHVRLLSCGYSCSQCIASSKGISAPPFATSQRHTPQGMHLCVSCLRITSTPNSTAWRSDMRAADATVPLTLPEHEPRPALLKGARAKTTRPLCGSVAPKQRTRFPTHGLVLRKLICQSRNLFFSVSQGQQCSTALDPLPGVPGVFRPSAPDEFSRRPPATGLPCLTAGGLASRSHREFTKGGLVKGVEQFMCYYDNIVAKPPFTEPPL